MPGGQVFSGKMPAFHCYFVIVIVVVIITLLDYHVHG